MKPLANQQDPIQAVLRDRQRLRQVLPRVLAKADETADALPPYIQTMLEWHRLHVEEAKLYHAGMGQGAIARLRPGRHRQAVDSGIKKFVKQFLRAYPELLEDKA